MANVQVTDACVGTQERVSGVGERHGALRK